VNVAVLAVLAFLANLLVGQLKSQTLAHKEARLESERRWALLALVSAAARNMSAVEPLVVLRAVVDSVVALGFPTTRIYVQEDGDYRAILPSGVPENLSEGIDSLRFEAVERVLSGGQPVVVGTVGDALGLEDGRLKARVVMAQGRQNTNYGINLYACHPFFIQGIATMTNGENTAFVPIKEWLLGKNIPGYLGYHSDSETFTHNFH